jgi:hypothetical protein
MSPSDGQLVVGAESDGLFDPVQVYWFLASSLLNQYQVWSDKTAMLPVLIAK